MSQDTPEYWNLDLSKLTISGWLLFLASLGVCAAVFSVFFLMIAFFFGNPNKPENDSVFRGTVTELACTVIALPLSGWFFVSGKKVLSSAGFPIMRQ